jgi:formylglycine-generating enzyme required for sulfatase activity
MGSDSGPEESKPAHRVNVDAFYIDKYEVTNAQYKEFCDATNRAYPATQPWDENYFIARPDAPVVGVSFEDAKAYANWVGKRLPNEKEWEKAASWDDSTKTKSSYPWGSEFDASKCAFGLGSPSDVGRFAGGASPSGAYDMAGNAIEWVDEFFRPYPGGNSSNPEFGDKNRVVRGGFVSSKSNDFLMTTKRVFVPPGFVPSGERDSFIGFRCIVRAGDPGFSEIVKSAPN